MSKFVVIGAGVIGVTTAWKLCELGHQVTLVDQNREICDGTSRENGAQLSYSYCDALASPALLSKLPGIFFRREPAFRINPSISPGFLRWSSEFLYNCRPTRAAKNSELLLSLAGETERLLPGLVEKYSLDFHFNKSGKLVLCHSDTEMKVARETLLRKKSVGIEQRVLDRSEAIEIEPALARYQDGFVGALYSPNDAAGSPPEFCKSLVHALTLRCGLALRLGARVERVVHRNGKLVGVCLESKEIITGEGVVIASGIQTHLLKNSGVARSNIWPVQGYSFTVPASADAMRCSITDPRRRMVFARLGQNIRVAGIADIGNTTVKFKPARFESLKEQAGSAFKGCFEIPPDVKGWTGGRPCTPSSLPLIGPTRMPGVFLNLGHGSFGWTLCLGSAERLSRSMALN